jgi:hypothetical protein
MSIDVWYVLLVRDREDYSGRWDAQGWYESSWDASAADSDIDHGTKETRVIKVEVRP